MNWPPPPDWYYGVFARYQLRDLEHPWPGPDSNLEEMTHSGEYDETT